MALAVKNQPANSGDITYVDLIRGWGRSLKKGNGNPLQYSCLENSMDRGVWQATVHAEAELEMTERLYIYMYIHTHTYTHIYTLHFVFKSC